MKKLLNTIFPAILIALCISGCEKDDICAETTPTTPRVMIEFYDASNTNILKNVTNLKAQADGQTAPYRFENGTFLTSGNSIGLPLDFTQETTTYTLTFQAENANQALINPDKITFNYTTQQVYVSRACGYKTIFRDVEAIGETSIEDPNRWIQNIIVENSNIETENEIHVKIYF